MYLSEWIEAGVAEGLAKARAEVRAEAIAEGRTEAQEQMLLLVTRMLQDNRQDEISRLANDPSFLTEMLRKYHL